MAMASAEREAEGLLRSDWWGDRDYNPFLIPVDPIRIARNLDIKVFELDLGDVSGMLEKVAGDPQPRIYLNDAEHYHRRRFTCGHEIGHYIAHTIDGDNEAFEYLDRRNHLSSSGTDAGERWANAFAAALLMPAQYVIDHYDIYGQTGLAGELLVSQEAMGHRIANLRKANRL